MDEGRKETLSKFTVTYDTFIETSDNFFRKRAEAGYIMQMFFNGMPVGDPTKRIIQIDEKFKEENVKFLIDIVTTNVTSLVSTAIQTGMQAKSLQKVPRQIKGKKN